MFNQKGYKLSGVRGVSPWDRKATPTTFNVQTSSSEKKDDYYLLRQDGL
jgi:hypothetical protein